MKKYLLISIFIIGCTPNAPENLISEEKMESIIFDIMILNASSIYDLKIDNNMINQINLILNNQIENHEINTGDIIILASVGAGMNINAIVYKQ